MISTEAAGIKILRQGYWENNHLCGQLTEIQYRGHICYVRENYRYDSFGLTSNQRLSFKMGWLPPGTQVLELRADKSIWEELAAKVKDTDPLSRPVCKGRFSIDWINSTFTRCQ